MKVMLLFVCALSLFLVSCDKPKSPENPYGPEVSPFDIQKAQALALRNITPEKIQIGQRAHFVETQELITTQGPINRLFSEWTLDVVKKEDVSEVFIFTTIKNFVDHTKPDKPLSRFKGLAAFQKVSKEIKAATEEFQLSQKLMESETPAKVEEDIEIIEVRFHNLVTKPTRVAPPEAVKNSENCGDLLDCRIDATQLTYDVVFKFSDGSEQIHQVEWIISDKVPFFSSILKQCASSLVRVDDLRVIVKQCQRVIDFSKTAPIEALPNPLRSENH